MQKGYLLFFTTASAFEAEIVCKSLNLIFKLTPTPREFSSDCGIAIYFEVQNLQILQEALQEANIEFEMKLL